MEHPLIVTLTMIVYLPQPIRQMYLNPILLQTLHAMISASATVPVHVLFDSGNHLSYVTKRLQQQLNFKPVRIEKLHLNTFGNNMAQLKGNAASLNTSPTSFACVPLELAVGI